MSHSTTPGQASFPSETVWSLVLNAASRESPEWRTHLEALTRRYWKPVWWYLVRHWNCSREDAADLAQEFFVQLFESEALKQASPERGRFRTFIKLKLKDLVLHELRRRSAQKRGGRAAVLSIHQESAEEILGLKWKGLSPQEEFDRIWAASLLSAAVEELRKKYHEEGKDAVFQAYWNCVVATPPLSYQQCAQQLGVKVSDVGHYVFRVRRDIRKALLRTARESVEREGEAERELAYILGLLEEKP